MGSSPSGSIFIYLVPGIHLEDYSRLVYMPREHFYISWTRLLFTQNGERMRTHGGWGFPIPPTLASNASSRVPPGLKLFILLHHHHQKKEEEGALVGIHTCTTAVRGVLVVDPRTRNNVRRIICTNSNTVSKVKLTFRSTLRDKIGIRNRARRLSIEFLPGTR